MPGKGQAGVVLAAPGTVARLVEHQDGVVSHAQLMDVGIGRGWVGQRLRSHDWRLLHPGVYVTHTGPVGFRARVWAGLLHAGTQSVGSHRTAGFLQGLVDSEPDVVEVCVPFGHGTTVRPGLRVRRRRRLDELRRSGGSIPITSIEHTVLDLTDLARDPDAVVGWLTRACQRRLTTPQRLAEAASGRARLRHRRLLGDVLDDVRDGVASPLEHRYARYVERAHGLPSGERNARQVVVGVNRYSDVHYRRWRTRVELEGLAYHPADGSHRDQARDNAAVLSGDAVLRYGWRAVIAACCTASQVAAVLRRQGWDGELRACSPTCRAGHLSP
jgi:hypothetical protein